MNRQSVWIKVLACFCASYCSLWTFFEVFSYFGYKPIENSGMVGHAVYVSIALNIGLICLVRLLIINSTNMCSNVKNIINRQTKEIGITYFFASRKDYARYRPNTPTIDSYVLTAKKSLIMVSVNLMTGLPFDGLCNTIRKMLEDTGDNITVTVSLLNYSKRELMLVMAPILNETPKELCNNIKVTLKKLVDMKDNLSSNSKKRLKILVHNSVPFGSAILIDHRHENGRIQIETKPYKTSFSESISFEVAKTENSCLYTTLCRSYEELLEDGNAVDGAFLNGTSKTSRGNRQ